MVVKSKTWLICRKDSERNEHALAVTPAPSARAALNDYWGHHLNTFDGYKLKSLTASRLTVIDKMGEERIYTARKP